MKYPCLTQIVTFLLYSYIDLFLAEQEAKRGNFFTDEDLIINCQA